MDLISALDRIQTCGSGTFSGRRISPFSMLNTTAFAPTAIARRQNCGDGKPGRLAQLPQ